MVDIYSHSVLNVFRSIPHSKYPKQSNSVFLLIPTIPYNSSSYEIERDSYTIMPVLLFLKISTIFCLYIMLKFIKSILKRNLL